MLSGHEIACNVFVQFFARFDYIDIRSSRIKVGFTVQITLSSIGNKWPLHNENEPEINDN